MACTVSFLPQSPPGEALSLPLLLPPQGTWTPELPFADQFLLPVLPPSPPCLSFPIYIWNC